MGFRCRADEDAGDGVVIEDGLQLMDKGAAGEEGGELAFPVRVLCTDIFEPDIKMTQDGVEAGHAMDAEADKGIGLLRVEEGGLKILFFPVVIKSL